MKLTVSVEIKYSLLAEDGGHDISANKIISFNCIFAFQNGRQVEGDNGSCICYFLSDRRQVAIRSSKFSMYKLILKEIKLQWEEASGTIVHVQQVCTP